MELSPEDSFKLNVLLSQNLQAVRIDESKMTVHALTTKGEAQVVLNPTLRDDQYLRHVREFFSNHALGSPGGYPVYLKRWTRMGQAREDKLDSLLILGEPEAVVAVAHAEGLTDELARRTWWAMPTAEVARKMLANPNVAKSTIGLELADFLLEFLPFETEARHIIESVKLVLTPGLIDANTKQSLWKRALRKSAYYIGFIYAIPEQLPEPEPGRSDYESLKTELGQSHNALAKMLLQLSASPGQTLLSTVNKAMNKASDQDMVVELFKAMEQFFQSVRPETGAVVLSTPAEIDGFVGELKARQTDAVKFIQQFPQYQDQILAIYSLSLVGESLANPVFAQTDAVGSVMRKKLNPIFDWLKQQIALLKTTAA